MDDSPIHSPAAAPLSRRRMLSLGAAGLAAAALGLPSDVGAAPQPCQPGRPCTPEEALKALMDGNDRFIHGRMRPRPTVADARRTAADPQRPFAAVLACADSRQPVEVLFDQNFGDVFVCRSAGNIITSELVGSFEFGTQVLGARVLLVLGHSGCGAVRAAAAGDSVPGQISSLYARIQPGVQRSGGSLDRAIAENVREQVMLLRNASTVLARRVREGSLRIDGAVANLGTGEVTLLPDPSRPA